MRATAALGILAISLSMGATAATAAGSEGSAGAGAEYQLSGLGGASFVYDGGSYHAGAFLGYSDGGGDDDTDFELGGRFYYHVHSTAMSDFGLGGSLGFGIFGDRNDQVDNDRSEVFIEPSAQIRAFVVQNVALSFTGGFSIGTGDAEGARITGQPVGAGGVHYYFF
jgi:hypothetical protein